MFTTYIRIAKRRLFRNKFASSIHIGGLAVGMSVAMLIGLWIYDELSFDHYHKNHDSIAQVMQHQHFNDDIHTDKAIPMPLCSELRNSYGSDFKYLVLSSWTNPHALSFKEKTFSATGNFMEPHAAEMLTLNMIKGSRRGLNDISSVLLSHSTAKAIFDDAEPLGKTISLDSVNVIVTGVYEDLPYNSSFRNVTFIASWELYASIDENKNQKENWNANSHQLFAQIADNRNMDKVSIRIKDVKKKAIGEDAAKLKPEIFLHPMNRWHLYQEFKNGMNNGGLIQYVWMFGTIAVNPYVVNRKLSVH